VIGPPASASSKAATSLRSHVGRCSSLLYDHVVAKEPATFNSEAKRRDAKRAWSPSLSHNAPRVMRLTDAHSSTNAGSSPRSGFNVSATNSGPPQNVSNAIGSTRRTFMMLMPAAGGRRDSRVRTRDESTASPLTPADAGRTATRCGSDPASRRGVARRRSQRLCRCGPAAVTLTAGCAGVALVAAHFEARLQRQRGDVVIAAVLFAIRDRLGSLQREQARL